MVTWTELEKKIENTVELSSICRGEWCRSLESDIDVLNSELYDFMKSGKVNEQLRYEKMYRKMLNGYRNLSPDIHV